MADIIKNFPQRLHKMTKSFYGEVPSQTASRDFVDRLVNLLFPIRDKKELTARQTEEEWEELQKDFRAIVRPLCGGMDVSCEELSRSFFSGVPLIFTNLVRDAQMYHNCDPASYCPEEIILCYPGFYAVMVYRFANVMYRLGIPILPRVISEYAHSQTGIDINPGATIGKCFYIDHGTGVVIGESCVIGNNVKVYQGVTLGASFVKKDLGGKKRHPDIEDNVIIYAGATILGGDTVIGHDTVVGGNVWITESVPPNSKVYHRADIIIKDKK